MWQLACLVISVGLLITKKLLLMVIKSVIDFVVALALYITHEAVVLACQLDHYLTLKLASAKAVVAQARAFVGYKARL